MATKNGTSGNSMMTTTENKIRQQIWKQVNKANTVTRKAEKCSEQRQETKRNT